MADKSLIRLVIEDMIAARERLSQFDLPVHRREVVRATLAAAEGVTWIFREHVRAVSSSLETLGPMADLALRERVFNVTAQGDVVEQVRFMPLTTIFRLVAKQAIIIDPRAVIDFSHRGWDDLQKAVQVRHRVTHPKIATDLDVGDVELKLMQSGLSWLLASVEFGMAMTTLAFADDNRNMRDFMDALSRGDEGALAAYRHELSRTA